MGWGARLCQASRSAGSHQMPQGGEDAHVNVFEPELVTSACVVHLQGSGCQEPLVSDSVFVHEPQRAPGDKRQSGGLGLETTNCPGQQGLFRFSPVGKHVTFFILFLDFSGLEHALLKLTS